MNKWHAFIRFRFYFRLFCRCRREANFVTKFASFLSIYFYCNNISLFPLLFIYMDATSYTGMWLFSLLTNLPFFLGKKKKKNLLFWYIYIYIFFSFTFFNSSSLSSFIKKKIKKKSFSLSHLSPLSSENLSLASLTVALGDGSEKGIAPRFEQNTQTCSQS